MVKYAIKLTKDDDFKILGIYDAKEDAKEHGKAMRKVYSRDDGLISLIEADFDDDGNMIANRYKLLDSFR